MDAASRQQAEAPAETEQAVRKFLQEHCGLPHLRNTAPERPSYVANLFCFHVFPAFRLRWVSVASVGHIHEFHIGVPGRRYSFVLTSLACLILGNTLSYLHLNGQVSGVKEVRFTLGEAIGTIAMPTWAIPAVLKNISAILESNEDVVQFLYAELERIRSGELVEETNTLH